MAQASGSRPRHVIFIGDTGSGKSSVINLILGHDRATVSPDAKPCTSTFSPYDVSLGGRTYRLWDTPGLNSPSGRFFRRGLTVDSLKRNLQEKRRHGELDLLVLCVHGRVTNAMLETYRTFCHVTQRIAPVVIAITCLERERPMDAWWQRNETRLRDLGLVFDGHACLTCLPSHVRRADSQGHIRALISAEYP